MRSFVMFLVVVMHSNETYSGFGDWYYTEVRFESLDLPSTILFGKYGSFASYIVLFIFGLSCGEQNLLNELIGTRGLRWFKLVLIVIVPTWAIIMIAGGALAGRMDFAGGMNAQSLGYAFWEAFVAIGFSIGLLAFFRKHVNFENVFTRFLAQYSFGVFMLHPPVLIAISLSLA